MAHLRPRHPRLHAGEDGEDGSVRVRIDDAEWRIQIHPGETDEVAYFGWAVSEEGMLPAFAERLRAAGLTVHTGDRELAEKRSVDQLIWFEDPGPSATRSSGARSWSPAPSVPDDR
ncbi:hypothetical protein ACR6C2_38870 [Streptomyces sp. INA 01156]